jgi:hypothetical protein
MRKQGVQPAGIGLAVLVDEGNKVGAGLSPAGVAGCRWSSRDFVAKEFGPSAMDNLVRCRSVVGPVVDHQDILARIKAVQRHLQFRSSVAHWNDKRYGTSGMRGGTRSRMDHAGGEKPPDQLVRRIIRWHG